MRKMTLTAMAFATVLTLAGCGEKTVTKDTTTNPDGTKTTVTETKKETPSKTETITDVKTTKP